MHFLQKAEGRKLHWAIIITSALCFSLFGYDQGVLGGLISSPVFLEAIGNPNPIMQGLTSSIYNIGCMIGCLGAALYGMRFGRRNNLIGGCFFILVGGAGQSATYHIASIMIFRVITGIGTGLISSTVPVWISEISAAEVRGRMVAIQLTIVLSGNVTAYWLDYGLSFINSSVSFRFPLAFQCFYPLVALSMLIGLPESPRVLYFWNQPNQADRVLCRLHGLRGSPEEHEATRTQKRDIMESIAFEMQQTERRLTWQDLFWDKSDVRNSRRLAIVIILQALQQLGGCNVVAYYQTKLFLESVHLEPGVARLVAGCSAITFFLGTLPAIYLIEAWGRRKLLLIGSICTLASMTAFTALIATGDGKPSYGWAAVAMIFLFEFTFASSWNCVVWVYAPEISPLKFRHVNSALGAMSEWAFTFLTVMIAPSGIANLGWKIYIVFIVFNAIQLPFVYLFVPETAGKTLEELDMVYAKRPLILDDEANVDSVSIFQDQAKSE